MWKNFFFFSRGERTGIYVLYCLVGLMFSVNFCISHRPESDAIVAQEVAFRRDTLFIHDTVKEYIYSKENRTKKADYHTSDTNTKGKESRKSIRYDTVRVELNSADTTELKRLHGIGSVLSARIVKYRKKLGHFTSVEQLKNVYGLSEETYQQIEPHIWINDVTLQP